APARRAPAPPGADRGTLPATARPCARGPPPPGAAPGRPAGHRRVGPSTSIIPSPSIVFSPLSCRAAGGLVRLFRNPRKNGSRSAILVLGSFPEGHRRRRGLAMSWYGSSSRRDLRESGEFYERAFRR